MPTYLSPGVYVKEVSGGVKPISGVGTSTGAFVGIAEKGVINEAVLGTNWSQFVKEFGGFTTSWNLAYAVYCFFAEGGTSCYVVRVANTTALDPDEAARSSGALVNDADPSVGVIEVTAGKVMDVVVDAKDPRKGTWGDKITIEIAAPSDEDGESATATHFKLTVTYEEEEEVYDDITITEVEAAINGKSELIEVSVIPGSPNETTDRPVDTDGPITPLSGGNNGHTGADYIGDKDNKKGLHAFDVVDGINIVAIPDQHGVRATILSALNYCKNRGDCFFIADPLLEESPSDMIDFKGATGDYAGENAFNSSYGALYYPWVYISDPLTGTKKLIPPSGAVAGTYAHTDSTRGVHKAPAGIAEGYLDSVVGIERIITKGEHDLLNPAGINVIRSLPAGICIWGARTLSADSEWLYINVRRLLLNIEESIDKGSQWVVFEPNDPTLWGRVKRNITAFLLRVWRDGALFGGTQEEAFFVKVDEENNPPEVRDAGQLIIEVGVAPVKPAEFVIIKISQKTLTK